VPASSTGFVHGAELPHLGWANPSIRKGVGFGQQPVLPLEPLALAFPGRLDPRADGRRGLAQPAAGQLFVWLPEPASTRGTSMWMSTNLCLAQAKIGRVQEGSGDPLLVAARHPLMAHHRVGTGALFYGVAVPAAGAGMQTERTFCSASR